MSMEREKIVVERHIRRVESLPYIDLWEQYRSLWISLSENAVESCLRVQAVCLVSQTAI
jgi:hypothetical protein